MQPVLVFVCGLRRRLAVSSTLVTAMLVDVAVLYLEPCLSSKFEGPRSQSAGQNDMLRTSPSDDKGTSNRKLNAVRARVTADPKCVLLPNQA